MYEFSLIGEENLRLGFNGFEFGNVIWWNVALLTSALWASKPPVALSVVEDLQMLPLSETEVLVRPRVVVIQGDEKSCICRVACIICRNL